jgi:hypothetical protein
MNDAQRRFECIRIWLEAKEGRATDQELRQLNDILETDAGARRAIVELTQQQGWFAWHGMSAPGLALAAMDEALLPPAEMPTGERNLTFARGSGGEGGWESDAMKFSSLRKLHVPLLSWQMAAIALAVFLVSSVPRWLEGGKAVDSRVAVVPTDNPVEALVTTATPCLWSDSNQQSTAQPRQFLEGDAIKLLEGVADLHIALKVGSVKLQIEGPVAFVLGHEGITNLSYGKIAIDNSDPYASSFGVETAFGRVVAQPGSQIGVSAFANQIEVHAFRGKASLESPWLVSDAGELTSMWIEPQRAVRLSQESGSAIEFTHMSADRAHFTPYRSLQASYLEVTPTYVEAVMAAKPAAYWRFEGETDGMVRNEMGDSFKGTLVGDYRWIGPPHSQSIEFGVFPRPGIMRVMEDFDEILVSDFACELWIRPSHFHHGTVLSFAGPFDEELRKNPLGICVETIGGWGDSAITNRVRMLVRSPAGYIINSSIYSDCHYQPRHWQYVVAQRVNGILQIYLDGELVKEAPGKPDTPPGLQLVVGQLYTNQLFRPFNGCVDEMAVYGRALSSEEIKEHYEANHPKTAGLPSS